MTNEKPSPRKTTSARKPAPARHGWHELALNAFLTALDPRGDSEDSYAIQLALACSLDPRFHEFLERLYQPRYRRHSLAAIAKSCDISLGEFVAFWQNAQVERAITSALRAAPAIVEAMGSDALGREVVCDRCDGLGWVEIVGIAARVPPEIVPGYLGRIPGRQESRRTCLECGGSGKMREPGDPHAIDRVLEIAGVFGNRRGVRQVSTYNYKSDFETLNLMTVDAEDCE